MDERITVLNLSTRTKNALMRRGIVSVNQLVSFVTPSGLDYSDPHYAVQKLIDGVAGMGKKGANEVINKLERHMQRKQKELFWGKRK